jgi:hypothetical protein
MRRRVEGRGLSGWTDGRTYTSSKRIQFPSPNEPKRNSDLPTQGGAQNNHLDRPITRPPSFPALASEEGKEQTTATTALAS